MDKAGREYWNDSWLVTELTEAINPSNLSIENYVNRRFHNIFLDLFNFPITPGTSLLELGCAKSSWLPYFAKEYGFKVFGIDYSPIGCRMAEKILDLNGIEAEIICSNFFEPPEKMLNSFDVVVSFGVVEHFENTAECLKSAAAFLKPGGVMFTSVPNLVGWNGAIQKKINKPVYDIHKLINQEELKEAHELAGLDTIECNYFISSSFGVINITGVPTNNLVWFMKKILLSALARISKIVWWIESKTCYIPPSVWTSPYIICTSRRSNKN
jgi:2-polyprenyl-3-methyl-5-hydroxy-6-metoxy-1,4-benzoquinol methylase